MFGNNLRIKKHNPWEPVAPVYPCNRETGRRQASESTDLIVIIQVFLFLYKNIQYITTVPLWDKSFHSKCHISL